MAAHQKEVLTRIFNGADKNNNGVLEFNEVKVLLEKRGYREERIRVSISSKPNNHPILTDRLTDNHVCSRFQPFSVVILALSPRKSEQIANKGCMIYCGRYRSQLAILKSPKQNLLN